MTLYQNAKNVSEDNFKEVMFYLLSKKSTEPVFTKLVEGDVAWAREEPVKFWCRGGSRNVFSTSLSVGDRIFFGAFSSILGLSRVPF